MDRSLSERFFFSLSLSLIFFYGAFRKENIGGKTRSVFVKWQNTEFSDLLLSLWIWGRSRKFENGALFFFFTFLSPSFFPRRLRNEKGGKRAPIYDGAWKWIDASPNTRSDFDQARLERWLLHPSSSIIEPSPWFEAKKRSEPGEQIEIFVTPLFPLWKPTFFRNQTSDVQF